MSQQNDSNNESISQSVVQGPSLTTPHSNHSPSASSLSRPSSTVTSMTPTQHALVPFRTTTTEPYHRDVTAQASQQSASDATRSLHAGIATTNAAPQNTIEPRLPVYDLQANPHWNKETSFKNEVRLLGKSQWRDIIIDRASTYVNMELAAWMVLHLLGVSLKKSRSPGFLFSHFSFLF